MPATANLRTIGELIERLFDDIRAATGPRQCEQVEELVRVVTELYGAGLERIVEVVGANAPEAMTQLLGDELVASLLLVHGLHPNDLATRVGVALDGVRPFLAQHGGDVELLDIDAGAGAVLLRLHGNCDGCPSSAVTLQHAVERAIVEAAPEIVIIDVEQTASADGAVPVTLGPRAVFDGCPTEVRT